VRRPVPRTSTTRPSWSSSPHRSPPWCLAPPQAADSRARKPSTPMRRPSSSQEAPMRRRPCYGIGVRDGINAGQVCSVGTGQPISHWRTANSTTGLILRDTLQDRSSVRGHREHDGENRHTRASEERFSLRTAQPCLMHCFGLIPGSDPRPHAQGAAARYATVVRATCMACTPWRDISPLDAVMAQRRAASAPAHDTSNYLMHLTC
jgi:hypothetical protein